MRCLVGSIDVETTNLQREETITDKRLQQRSTCDAKYFPPSIWKLATTLAKVIYSSNSVVCKNYWIHLTCVTKKKHRWITQGNQRDMASLARTGCEGARPDESKQFAGGRNSLGNRNSIAAMCQSISFDFWCLSGQQPTHAFFTFVRSACNL